MAKKILHLVQRNDNKPVAVAGNLWESGHWELSDEEKKATQVALHASKKDRSRFGGEVVEIRVAEESELPPGLARGRRHVIRFKPTADTIRGLRWGGSATYGMAYKSLEDID